MIMRAPRVDSPLEQAVKQLARQCRRRRLIHCGFRFGLASLALALIRFAASNWKDVKVTLLRRPSS